MPPINAKSAKPAKPSKADNTEKPARAKPAPARKAAPEPVAEAAAMVRLKDLVETVAAATGLKKPAAKQAVEATLAALSDALSANATLTAPPLGKLRVVKSVAGSMTLKLRPAGAAKPAAKALADNQEDD